MFKRWVLEPVASVQSRKERQDATVYAAFVLVLAALGLTMGLWVFPTLQGAEDFTRNRTWQTAALASLGLVAAYVLARLGRLLPAALWLVCTTAVSAYSGASDDPHVLLFMNAAVVMASALLPFRVTLVFATLTALAPFLLSLSVPGLSYWELGYIQSANLLLPALLLLMSWYKNQLLKDRQEQNARLAELVRGSPDGILLADQKSRIVSCNPAIEELSGYPAHRLVGMELESLGLASLTAHQAAGDGAADLVVTEIRCQNGARHAVECLVRRVDDLVLGRGLQIMLRDVAERQRIREQQACLERELHEARRLEALGRLAGGIAHDINNQLTVILGSADLIADEAPGEDLNAICRAADHSRRLVSQLLTFARGQTYQPSVLDVDQLLRELEPILRTLVRDNVRLQLKPEATHATVEADRTQLEQVVINLAGNACDAMPNGGELRIRTSIIHRPPESDDPNQLGRREVLIEVKDEGTGIDAETSKHMFEPFFTTKTDGVGTGLGLATVHGIVTRAGGRVVADSKPGRGTVFSVYLPWHEATLNPSLAPPKASSTNWQSLRVLVVDDQRMVGDLVTKVLKGLGSQTVTARDPFDAERMFEAQSHAFDVLISDVIMPGLTGPDLARRLRARRPDLHVLFMTGYPRHEDLSHEHVLMKPFDKATLVRALERALAGPPSARFDHAKPAAPSAAPGPEYTPVGPLNEQLPKTSKA